MAKAAAVGAMLCAALFASACSPFGGVKAFTCSIDEDCSGGFCEADSLCSFTDATCTQSGRRYGDLAGGQSGKCVGGGDPIDAPVDQPVTPPEAGDMCFGIGGIVEPCFAPGEIPAGAIALTAAIDTTNDPLCSADVKGTADCVIAGGSISIAAGVTINVTGSRALILLATNGSITIEGVLNGASKRGGTTGPKFNDPTCNPGTPPGVSAGGAGGSFGTLGGNGGIGATANPGGVAGAIAGAITSLRGGCRGQDGTLSGANGVAGDGGGSIYLIATTSIVLQGTNSQINASGASSTGGAIPQGGAGGGGSGGLIGLFAPTLTNQGTIFAKGGGGGEGSGSAGGANGNPGQDPAAAGAGAGGGGASGTGGDGGAGATTVGGNPGGNSTNGGGGGGGGAGVIKLFGGATTVGTIVPAPS